MNLFRILSVYVINKVHFWYRSKSYDNYFFLPEKLVRSTAGFPSVSLGSTVVSSDSNTHTNRTISPSMVFEESSVVTGANKQLAGVQCRLETKELWGKFHDLGTEMIITKTGR